MVPGERSKSAEVTELLKHFLRLNKTFDNLPEYKETTFLQPFTVLVSLGRFVKKQNSYIILQKKLSKYIV